MMSTCSSNYFRNRAALVAAAVDRVEQQDMHLLRHFGTEEPPTTVAALAEQLATAVLTLATDHADLTRARFAFALDQPGVVTAGHERMLGGMEMLLESMGLPGARLRAEAVADYSDGLAMHLLTARRGQHPDHATVAANIRRLLEG
ncbi:TetR/AcrR family transcriptional regulator [Paenarthrobacter sp. NCHU4564]|uniref:TetR/AcrR family transcriptional regulator n=1 Tax=Paenarthrobacter sp. NCHU4564 TaxID=3451353 RepID=UPI003F95BD3D